jgi:hypothetical protein
MNTLTDESNILLKLVFAVILYCLFFYSCLSRLDLSTPSYYAVRGANKMVAIDAY